MPLKKKILGKKELNFLEKYLNANSPTSYETQGQKIWLSYIKPYIDTYEVDNYGTVYGVINPKAKYKVVIEAHADEISWYVSYIDKNGFIYVVRNGGSDHIIAPSMRVKLHTEKGKIDGIFGWPAIHLRKGKSAVNPTSTNIFIDVGASSKEEVLAMGINIGTVATFDADMMYLNKNKYVTGRALDNRVGGFMIAQVARLLKENKVKLPFGLYIVNSVMEEVGLRGAQMIAHKIKPDVAIVTDVAHDTSTPLIEKKEQGDFKCGAGPILTIGPAVQNNLLKLILAAADKNKLDYQLEAVYRATGTDTDAFAFSNAGVVSALISLPLRYMHTTVETAHISDIETVIKLYYYSLQLIKNGHDFRYLK